MPQRVTSLRIPRPLRTASWNARETLRDWVSLAFVFVQKGRLTPGPNTQHRPYRCWFLYHRRHQYYLRQGFLVGWADWETTWVGSLGDTLLTLAAPFISSPTRSRLRHLKGLTPAASGRQPPGRSKVMPAQLPTSRFRSDCRTVSASLDTMVNATVFAMIFWIRLSLTTLSSSQCQRLL